MWNLIARWFFYEGHCTWHAHNFPPVPEHAPSRPNLPAKPDTHKQQAPGFPSAAFREDWHMVNMGMKALQQDLDETKMKLERWVVLKGNGVQQVEAQNKYTNSSNKVWSWLTEKTVKKKAAMEVTVLKLNFDTNPSKKEKGLQREVMMLEMYLAQYCIQTV